MNRQGLVAERALALFLLAFLAFNPPLLAIFSVDVFLFGVPLLYCYLFCAWAWIIVLVGLHATSAGRAGDEDREAAPRSGHRPGG